MISHEMDVWGHAAATVGGAWILVQDNASHIQFLLTWSVQRNCFLPLVWAVLDSHFSLGGTQRDLPAAHSQTRDTPRGLLQSGRCLSNPFYYSSCGRNNEHWHPLIILSPHQRQVQYTHPSLLFISNIEITSKFLSRFLTETCKHFMFVMVSIKLSSGGNAHVSW